MDHPMCAINDVFFHSWRLFRQTHMRVFKSAAGVSNSSNSSNYDESNKEYVDRLVKLIQNIQTVVPYKMMLLPMDHYYEEDGTLCKEKTGMYCSNEYVKSICDSNYNEFIPVTSIHPANPKALELLDDAHKKNIKYIKWLPNSMNIDASNKIYKPFYEKVKELDMKILVHVGHEHSVDAGYLNQSLGNPLKLRYPLDLGVKIVAAHAASENSNIDTDENSETYGRHVDNFDLFLRLCDEEKYKGFLYADISALLCFKRISYTIRLLDRTDLHNRLLFGSDYPVPCINLITSTRQLQYYGCITRSERHALNEIYKSNPLLFNFVTFRTIRSQNGNKFDKKIFERSINDI